MNRASSLLAAAVFLALPVLAAPAPLADFDPAALLPPPPADGSPAAKAELAELHHIEAVRTKAGFAQALADDQDESVQAFAGVMGPNFDLAKLPKTAALFSEVRQDEKLAGKRAKNFFHRKRPWIVDPSLKTCSREDSPLSSYPSGHTTMGYAMATVLAALAPRKATAIMTRARQYAENRLVCGMHFRSDIVAGQVLGTAVAVELMHDPAFKSRFDAARSELAAAHVIAD